MQTITPGIPFVFKYPTAGMIPGLFVAGRVYDVSTGTAVFVSSVVMTEDDDGVYSGNFVGGSAKSYLVIAAVYIDNTYSTVDIAYPPEAENFKSLDAPQAFACFNYGAFDQDIGLYVGANIYDCTSGTPAFDSFIPMPHVFAGVYSGVFTGVNNGAYAATSLVYTDPARTIIDTGRAPGSDSFTLFNSVVSAVIVNVLQQATLVANTGRRGRPFRQVVGFTQGDDQVILNFLATGGNGLPVDLTGAVLTTTFRALNGSVISFPNSQHTINPDQVAAKGQFSLLLSSSDTMSTPAGSGKEVITQAVISSGTTYYHGASLLNVLRNIPVK